MITSSPFPLLALSSLLLSLPPPSTPDWTSDCTTRYPASCRCTWSSGKRLANCEKSNMNAIPTLSNEIQILDMSNNKLTSVQDNAFTLANLINLQKLYLKGCKIGRVHELAFNNLRILIEVDLSHNELEALDPVVFSTNVRLRVIKLNNNRIHTLGEFPVLEYLNSIDLSYNALSNITRHTFSGLRNLKVLDLSHNAFTNLDPSNLPRLSSLMLRGNNWVCDCELKPLRDYVIAYKFIEGEVRCTEPLNLFNSQWDGFEELSCKPEIVNILANGRVVDSIVALENTLVLSCVVKGDPLPDVKWVRNGRVVQDVVGDVREADGVVVMNLTVGKFDNEFVCVGSNSGGVVERNLTVTVDEAGLSGFVVLKDGGNGLFSNHGDRGNVWRSTGMLVYLVIGVVFLSLIVGLVVGGVCVWRWGKGGAGGDRGVGEGESVVKGVLKVVGGGGGNNRVDNSSSGGGGGGEERLMMMTNNRGGNDDQGNEDDRLFLSEGGGGGGDRGVQTPLLLTSSPSKPHKSADDLLSDPYYPHPSSSSRPTPDLLVLNNPRHEEEDDDDEGFNFPRFPQNNHHRNAYDPDSTSLYDNYELAYKPICGTLPSDALRRLAFLRGTGGGGGNMVKRPSSVCSEPRGSPGHNGRLVGNNSPSVIIPHGYVTLPRNRASRKGSGGNQGVIKYDNLGRRTTADGSSKKSLNTCGLPPESTTQPDEEIDEPQYQPIHYGTLPLHSTMEPPQPAQLLLFEPIIESREEEKEDVEESGRSNLPIHDPVATPSKKFRPVPPPKPKKKKKKVEEEEGDLVVADDDDGTEV